MKYLLLFFIYATVLPAVGQMPTAVSPEEMSNRRWEDFERYVAENRTEKSGLETVEEYEARRQKYVGIRPVFCGIIGIGCGTIYQYDSVTQKATIRLGCSPEISMKPTDTLLFIELDSVLWQLRDDYHQDDKKYAIQITNPHQLELLGITVRKQQSLFNENETFAVAEVDVSIEDKSALVQGSYEITLCLKMNNQGNVVYGRDWNSARFEVSRKRTITTNFFVIAPADIIGFKIVNTVTQRAILVRYIGQ